MAHLSAVPIRLNDGCNVKGLRVLELKTALVSFGVPEPNHAQNKADKLVQLLNSLSKSRASQGSRGALDEGRLIGALSVVELRSAIAARGLQTSWAASILSSNASFVFVRIVLRL